MNNEIKQFSEHIINISKEQKELAKEIRKTKPELIKIIGDLKEKNFKICGVDGGFLKKEYHGAGLIIRRAVAVCFEYANQKLLNAKYFPNKNPAPEPIFISSELIENDFSTEANLRRVETELNTTITALERFKPNAVILDGSILIHPESIPNKKSAVYKTYQNVISIYKRLYTKCTEEDILLIGAIEDSRGKRFCRSFLKDCKKVSDTLLLHYLLKKGERTISFKYSSNDYLPFINELGKEWANSFHAFYLKSAEFDRPLRIEFLSSGESEQSADYIASIIHFLSKHNRYYCYPSVLIEADARAKLKEKDLEIFKQSLTEKTGNNPVLFEFRRETRPF